MSGPIQYYFYYDELSLVSEAYGQQQTLEINDGQVTIANGQQQTPDDVNDVPSDDEEDRSDDVDDSLNTARTSEQDDTDNGNLPPQPVQSPPQPVQSPSTSGTQTGVVANEENNSDQSTGPIKFAFVDSFWTDYTSLGGVIASTSADSITAQPLPPVTRQEVEPGQGEAVLAVVLRNIGFADATSISGSLDLPSGFRAIVTPENVDSDTALASYNGIVSAGQTFTLYFRVLVTAESQVGKEYTGELKLRYFRVDEQDEEDTRSTTLEIPFRLTGKVILNTFAVSTFSGNSITPGVQSSLSNIVTASAGVVNPLRIQISNNGSSVATGVVVNVLPPGTLSSSTAQSGVDMSSGVVNNSAENATPVPSQQVIPSSPASATMVIVGAPTFNIGIIGAKETREIVPSIFPADAAAGTLTTLNVQISYNDAYGNRKSLNQILGVQISPESPQSGLNVLPSSFTSWESLPRRSSALMIPVSFGTPLDNNNNNTLATPGDITTGRTISTSTNSANLSSNQPESIRIVAGSVEDLSFAVANDNSQGVAISDVVVSLSSESDALRILGDSRWDLQSIASGSRQDLSTQVYASTSLIGSPVFFTVTMQYIRNGNELSTESFQLGAVVVGDIEISVNDVAISYIGDTPNLVGNLLNEGNSPALFTKIELHASGAQGGLKFLQPTVTSQFLGDLAVNSPLAFNIPLQVSDQEARQEATGTDYPVSLKISYSDELRSTHEMIVNETISLEPLQVRIGQQPPNAASSEQNALLNNGFIDAYWVDSGDVMSSSNAGNLSNSAGTAGSTLPSEREVGPGEGPAFLAVVLSNTAFSDITGIIGYLMLPEGFAADTSTTGSSSLDGTNDSSSERTPSQTSVASIGNIVRAGQTYTLYFKVNVLEAAQKGFHEALLRINYFRVPEPQPGTYRVQTITVPFELPGRVILDASSETEDLIPGESNDVRLTIRNTGTADARGVIVNINAIGGSIITDSNQSVDSIGNNNASGNETVGDGQSEQQSSSSTAAVASIGARTFNIGSIPAKGSTEIATTVYPSSSAGGTLQNLDIEIIYNNANGDRRSAPLSIGFRVLPNPPEGGLSVTPSSSIERHAQERIILASTIAGSPGGNTTPNGNDASEVTIIAGSAHDMNFNITNNNRNPITDIVVTLASRSESLEIIGDSRWTLQELGPQSKARFSTRVFASDTLIGSPVSFEVGIQYISGDQIRSDSFSLGGNVVGEIKIGINELSIRNIGDVPNLTGNLLNQGNTNALFTTIELVRSDTAVNQSILMPVANTPQYLGDLEDNSPLPFSIPLAVGNSDGSTVAAGNYPVSLRITYSDELRNTHEVILNSTVPYNPPQQQEEAPSQGFLGFGSTSANNNNNTSSSVAILPLILGAIAVSALAILLVRRRRSKRKKLSRLMGSQDDTDDFDEALGEKTGSSQNNETSHKK
ncbi:MAG TPA: hypothetical protein VHF28_06650 [Nitrososphaera sp.]|nr:hypothetical protein [Nitrososphaera sp.]